LLGWTITTPDDGYSPGAEGETGKSVVSGLESLLERACGTLRWRVHQDGEKETNNVQSGTVDSPAKLPTVKKTIVNIMIAVNEKPEAVLQRIRAFVLSAALNHYVIYSGALRVVATLFSSNYLSSGQR
jgi:hypothetical protein